MCHNDTFGGTLLILRGYIDEAEDGKIFNLTAVVADGGTWFYFEQEWSSCLRSKNEYLKARGRPEISRYHATDCQFKVKEFKGWTNDERDEFCKQLFSLFEKYALHVLGYSVNLQELVAQIPEAKPNPRGFAYVILLCFVMLEIGDFTLGMPAHRNAVVSLVHDRCDYDAALSDMFEAMLHDPGFPYRTRFATLTSMGWEECVPLQPADFFAYENFKESQRLTLQPRSRRRSLEMILNRGRMGGRLRGFDRATLGKLKERIDAMPEESKGVLLAAARIKQPMKQ